jgi:hypothetical protein
VSAERDPMLRRIERTAMACCVVGAAAGFVLGGWRAGAGVLGGGALIALSYWAIKGGVDGFLGAATGSGETRRGTLRLAFALLRFVGRYALLAFFAYVMIARLRLHPVGLLTGASSLVLAAAVEAARGARRVRR